MRYLTRLFSLGWMVFHTVVFSGCVTAPIDWERIGGPPTPPTADDVVGIWEGTACGPMTEPYVRVELWPDGRGILSKCGFRMTEGSAYEVSWTLNDWELRWYGIDGGHGAFRGIAVSQAVAARGLVTPRLRMVHLWHGPPDTEYVFIREDHLNQMRQTVRRELEEFRRSLGEQGKLGASGQDVK